VRKCVSFEGFHGGKDTWFDDIFAKSVLSKYYKSKEHVELSFSSIKTAGFATYPKELLPAVPSGK
jgi:hypothetical protein